jgi:ribonuclease T2
MSIAFVPKRRAVQVMLVVVALLAAALAAARDRVRRADGTAARFDYFVMSLSWSPSYCLTHPNEQEQCGSKGFGFVLHGLWPQNRDGSWPQHCSSDSRPSTATIERTLAFMPSQSLIQHEWSTHGSCTGLDPAAYFELADRAFASIAIPEPLKTPRSPPALTASQIERGFAAANPGLDDSMLMVECHNGYELTEVRVCLDRDTLAPQACAGRSRNSCRSGALKIPAIR